LENLHLAKKAEFKADSAAFISNCHSKSDRDGVVKKLREHISIDVYGQCSDQNLVCDRSDDEKCLQMLSKSYKFYLAFENSLCTDYITEKFWKVLDYNVVPVVLNGVNMSHFAPRNSYIDIKDFSNISEAGKYLKKVSEDDKLYSSFFWWKSFYINAKPSERFVKPFCDLCAALHNESEPTSILTNFHKWWKQDGQC